MTLTTTTTATAATTTTTMTTANITTSATTTASIRLCNEIILFQVDLLVGDGRGGGTRGGTASRSVTRLSHPNLRLDVKPSTVGHNSGLRAAGEELSNILALSIKFLKRFLIFKDFYSVLQAPYFVGLLLAIL